MRGTVGWGRRLSAWAGGAGEGGFTLVELCIFAIIMLLLVAGVMGMLTGAFKSSSVSNNIAKLEDAAREALSTMTRQLRVAASIDAGSSNHSLTVTGDLDGNGTKESVNFSVANDILMKTVSGHAAEEWVSNVDHVTFNYYRPGVGDQAISPGGADWNTGVGRISIIIELSASGQGITTARTYEASVALRNSI